MFALENQNVVRRRELEANDFYDSDEDTFLDRTGSGKVRNNFGHTCDC